MKRRRPRKKRKLSRKVNDTARTKNSYMHPFKNGIKTIAISDPRAHFKHFKDAIDFLMKEGTPILATRDGIVTDVKDDSKEGGLGPKYADAKYLNYLTLQHDNGEYSQYCHLKHKGVLVKIGDKVKEGQQIAVSGNTGLSSAPHLHFMVFKLNKTKVGWKSLEVRWKNHETVICSEEEANKLLLTEEFKPLLNAVIQSRKNLKFEDVEKFMGHLRDIKKTLE